MNSKHRLMGGNLKLEDIIAQLASDNSTAISCMEELIQDDKLDAFVYFLFLDELNIYDTEIAILWEKCCSKKLVQLKKTFNLFVENKISRSEIHNNLNSESPKPFI